MGFFLDLFSSIPPWIRTLLSLVVVVTGVYYTYQGWRGHNAIKHVGPGNSVAYSSSPGSDGKLFVGISVTAIGCILFTLSPRSREEQAGYRTV